MKVKKKKDRKNAAEQKCHKFRPRENQVIVIHKPALDRCNSAEWNEEKKQARERVKEEESERNVRKDVSSNYGRGTKQ